MMSWTPEEDYCTLDPEVKYQKAFSCCSDDSCVFEAHLKTLGNPVQ